MRILHLGDRLTDRGGAYWHLLGVLQALREAGHEVHLVVGRDEGQVPAPCPVDIVPGLAARTAAEAPELDAIASAFAPDVIHVHTVLVAVGLAEEQVAVIPPFVHGLDPEAQPDGRPCVLFVGRLTATKGALEAVEAWRLSGLDMPLVVAGSGPLREAMEGSGAQVLGWINHPCLAAVYKSARVLVMPSRWQEPFGIAGLEAVSLGTPVAAWQSGGVAEWHASEGLVPWGDVPGLAAALRENAGRRAVAPSGFERTALMGRLAAIYEKPGTFSPPPGNR